MTQAHDKVFAELESQGWTAELDEGFMGLVGPLWRQSGDSASRYAFWAEDKHRNRRGVVQGGMLLTVADRAMGATARANDPKVAQATVQLSMNFLDAARMDELVEIECHVDRKTRSLVFVSGKIVQSDRTVAICTGVWKILGA